MLVQVDLLSLLLSPVLFYLGSAAIVLLLSHFKLLKAEA
jgi:hypothetical protein